MSEQVIWILAAVLAGLAYAVVASVISVAANRYRTEVEIHNRMRESREMRRQYLQSLKETIPQTTVVK